MYIYIYIYRERERERGVGGGGVFLRKQYDKVLHRKYTQKIS